MSLRNPRTISEAVENLRRLPEELRTKATKQISEDLEDLILSNWDAGRSPYGGTWAPKKDGTSSRLYDTGTMQGSLQVNPTSTGVVVKIDTPFEYHQYGTSRMPARPLLPTDGGVPGDWRDIVQQAVEDALDSED